MVSVIVKTPTGMATAQDDTEAAAIARVQQHITAGATAAYINDLCVYRAGQYYGIMRGTV
jgi:hypothetical protein